MKKFKIIDCWVSVALILVAAVYGVFQPDFDFLYGYFGVGAWQGLSMILHTWNGWFTNNGGARKNYHMAVAGILVLALAGMLYYPVLYIELCLLLFVAPVMALYYSRLCYIEVYVKMQRPLALLK